MPENEKKKPELDPNRALAAAYPSNSKKSKEETEKKAVKPERQEKIEGITAIKQKAPILKRIRQAFTGDDARSVGDYLMFEVLLPALKATLSDMVSQGTNRMLFGNAANAHSNIRRSGGGINYNQISRSTVNNRDEPRALSQRDRATHTFDNIVLSTRDEAFTVLGRLIDIVEQYDMATVSDLYELVDVTGSFADDRWGWFDLRGADVVPVRNGWILDLPDTKAIR